MKTWTRKAAASPQRWFARRPPSRYPVPPLGFSPLRSAKWNSRLRKYWHWSPWTSCCVRSESHCCWLSLLSYILPDVNRTHTHTHTLLGSSMIMSPTVTRQAWVRASVKVQSFTNDQAVICPLWVRGWFVWCVRDHSLTHRLVYNEL